MSMFGIVWGRDRGGKCYTSVSLRTSYIQFDLSAPHVQSDLF